MLLYLLVFLCLVLMERGLLNRDMTLIICKYK